MNRRFSCQGYGCRASVDFTTQYCLRCERRLDIDDDVDADAESEDDRDYEQPNEKDDHDYNLEVDW